jgi:hypothetical protein
MATDLRELRALELAEQFINDGNPIVAEKGNGRLTL